MQPWYKQGAIRAPPHVFLLLSSYLSSGLIHVTKQTENAVWLSFAVRNLVAEDLQHWNIVMKVSQSLIRSNQ